MSSRLKLQYGDITSMAVEAVVNSTRESLQEGGPVHAAIHRAAGPGLLEECELLDECPAGEVRITGGHELPARYVIHTVAPTWMGGTKGEEQLLASCYLKALRLAEARSVKELAFPSIGSGLQPQIPLDVAAPIAIRTILGFLGEHAYPERVILVCYDAATYQIHQKVLKEALP